MTKKDRQIVFDKYGGHCAYCGCILEKGWHVDHVEPCRRIISTEMVEQPQGVFPRFKRVDKLVGYSNPDANHIDNYMPSCPSCNINKHGGTIEEFRMLIKGFKKHLNEINTQYKISKRYGLVVEVDKPIVFYFEQVRTEIENL